MTTKKTASRKTSAKPAAKKKGALKIRSGVQAGFNPQPDPPGRITLPVISIPIIRY